jgi:glutathione S-transferase
LYELFYYPGNASLAPHFVLEEIGAPFVLRRVERERNAQKDPDYPMGRIPTLVDGDLVLFESAAICLHLADRHREARLVPDVATGARAHLYKWLMFLTNTIQPDVMAFYYPERYTTDSRGTEAVVAAAEARLLTAFAVVDEELGRGGPYLLGNDISVADLFLLMVVRWGRNQKSPPAKTFAAIRRCAELVSARPAVRRAAATEGLDPIY